MNNAAFIDGQNLRRGTLESENPWKVDLIKFRYYLFRKYNVRNAYYFLGYKKPELTKMYKAIESYGYELIFKESVENSISSKKGNVDTDIVFEIMKKTFNERILDKVVIISGDGDYYKTVKYLIKNNKLERIIGPNEKFMSALYKKRLKPKHYAYLSDLNVKNKIHR